MNLKSLPISCIVLACLVLSACATPKAATSQKKSETKGLSGPPSSTYIQNYAKHFSRNMQDSGFKVLDYRISRNADENGIYKFMLEVSKGSDHLKLFINLEGLAGQLAVRSYSGVWPRLTKWHHKANRIALEAHIKANPH